MSDTAESKTSLPEADLADGRVHRLGRWAVGTSGDEPFAVSRRCRHQLGDLSKGSVGSDGCLVCPWHGSRYDVQDGRMVAGPQGFLTYTGPTPGYSRLILAIGSRFRLVVGRIVRRDGRIGVE